MLKNIERKRKKRKEKLVRSFRGLILAVMKEGVVGKSMAANQ